LSVLWFGIAPAAGGFINRRVWRNFRQRFNDLCLKPWLDYASYSQTPKEGALYRFIGGFESMDRHTLWLSSDGLTIPVALENAQVYILPLTFGESYSEYFDPNAEGPEKIRWDQVALMTEGAKAFVGGMVIPLLGRPTFISTKMRPLLLIFYDCEDKQLAIRMIRAGRDKNEYWNPVTPYAFIAGIFSEFCIVLRFLSKPIFRYTAITACIAVCTPLLPLLPPGLLCTIVYRRLWRQARLFRSYRDILRFPYSYMPPGECEGRLPMGGRYGAVYYHNPPPEITESQTPLLIPKKRALPLKGLLLTPPPEGWYVFGRLPEGPGTPEPGIRALAGRSLPSFPKESEDPFVPFGATFGNPERDARRYAAKAYILEIISWLFLLTGIFANVVFILLIFILTKT
jgi:hypothetical protein